MTREDATTILDAIDRLATHPYETQYDCGPRAIDEKGIKVLRALVRGLVEDDD